MQRIPKRDLASDLTHPAAACARAQRRDHGDFLLRLKDALQSRPQLLSSIEAAAEAQGLRLEESGWGEAAAAMGGEYLRQNRVVDVAAALEERRRQEQQQQQRAADAP